MECLGIPRTEESLEPQSAAVSPGQKQKSRRTEGAIMPPSKIRKISNEQNRQNQSASSSQHQNLAEGLVSPQLTDDDPLDSSFGPTDQPQTLSSRSIGVATDLLETKKRIVQALLRQEELDRELKTLEERTKARDKQIQDADKAREIHDELQNICENYETLGKDRLVDVKSEVAVCRQEEQQIKIHQDSHLGYPQRRKDLMEQIEAEISKHMVLADRLESKKKEFSLVVAKTEQLETKATKLALIRAGVENEKKKGDALFERNQQRFDEKIREIDHAIENIQAELNVVRENNVKLKSQADEDSRRQSELVSKCEALRVSKRQRREHIEDLKRSIGDSEERQADTRTKIEELKAENLAIISERHVEHAGYRKQMEELKAKHAETLKKLSATKSGCEALNDSVTESVNDIEKLEKISDNKDHEIQKLRDELRDVLDLNKDLSAEYGSLKESLADVKKQIAQEKADFETLDSEDQSDRLDTEIRKELADLRRQCEEKDVLLSKLHGEMEAESLKSSREMAKLDGEIVNLDKQLGELQKSKEDYKRDIRKLDSELDNKLHESTQTSAQCLKAGHEKQLNQQAKKLENLRDEISAVNTERQRENEKQTKSMNKMRAEREAKMEESKSAISDLERKVSAAQKIRDDLKKRSKEARMPSKPESSAAPMTARQSSLISMCYTQNKQAPPATSTPEQNLEGADHGLLDNFGFGGSSDESSISPSLLFSDVERRYEKIQRRQQN